MVRWQGIGSEGFVRIDEVVLVMIDSGVTASTLVTTAEKRGSVAGWCVDGEGRYQREKI